MYLRYMTAHVRVNTSITCYAGYFAVHLLRKYTTMLGFLPLANSKIPLLRSAAASLLSDFLSCEPQTCIITFGDGLRLYHVSSIHDSTRSGEHFYNLLRRLFRRTFAAQIYDNAWFPSSCKLENPATS